MKTVKTLTLVLTMGCLSGCNVVQRMANLGDAPEKSQIQNPTLVDGYRPVSMPMPAPEPESQSVNSLWQTGSRAFFKDQRASRIGDIITVNVNIAEESVKVDSKNTYDRQTSIQAGAPNMLGYESKLRNIFPRNAVNPASLVNTTTNSKAGGTGKLDRKDTLKFKVGATIIQILPNGNFVIEGRQEVLFSTDLRIIEVKGIIRREDIASDNSIAYSKISEARISYSNKGDASDVNSVPWGQQAINKIWPW